MDLRETVGRIFEGIGVVMELIPLLLLFFFVSWARMRPLFDDWWTNSAVRLFRKAAQDNYRTRIKPRDKL